MDRDEMLAKLEDVAAEMGELMRAAGAHEPDWEPLEKAMPKLKWCSGFMFMGYVGEIRMYKHGFTRRYINLDPKGNAYFYKESTGSYFKVPLSVAIDHVFCDLKEMGVRRSTPFDDKAIAKRNKALADAGWTMVTADPRKPPKT